MKSPILHREPSLVVKDIPKKPFDEKAKTPVKKK